MARSRPLPRHQLTREQLRAAEELVRRGYFSKTAEERKRRDRVFRLTRAYGGELSAAIGGRVVWAWSDMTRK